MTIEINSATPQGTPPAGLIKDASTQSFRADVLEASLEAPVLVDFWAPWCGPCRQLTPALEKVVNEKGGKVRLVKVNIDENQALAGQMGIQSIPAVFAFAGGRPVDGFMGALPESEVRRFIDKVIAGAPAAKPQEGSLEEQIGAAMEAAEAALAARDFPRAAQIFGMVIQHQPDHAEALIGIARVYLEVGELDEARAALDQVPEPKRTGAGFASVESALRLATEAAELSGGGAELEARLAADPDDHEARFELAILRNGENRRVEAAEALVALMKRDREWNEDGARRKLLEFFEAWGPKDPATLKGRRLLSALLFS